MNVTSKVNSAGLNSRTCENPNRLLRRLRRVRLRGRSMRPRRPELRRQALPMSIPPLHQHKLSSHTASRRHVRVLFRALESRKHQHQVEKCGGCYALERGLRLRRASGFPRPRQRSHGSFESNLQQHLRAPRSEVSLGRADLIRAEVSVQPVKT